MWSTLGALQEQILEAVAPRRARQGKETVVEVFSEDRFQQRLVKQMVEVRKLGPEGEMGMPETVIVADLVEGVPVNLGPQMVEQLVDVLEIVVELAVSSGEAGSSWPGGRDTTSAFVAVPVDEVRPPGVEETVEAVTLVPQLLVGAARPLGSSQYRMATESEFEGSPGVVQQLQKLLLKLGLPSLTSTVRPQNQQSQCPLVKLGPLDAEHMTWTVPPSQQPQRLEKLGILRLRSRVPRRSLNSRRGPVKLDLIGPRRLARPVQWLAAAVANSDETRPPGGCKAQRQDRIPSCRCAQDLMPGKRR